jgi:cytochrome o ubiquinol oxidase subunit 2
VRQYSRMRQEMADGSSAPRPAGKPASKRVPTQRRFVIMLHGFGVLLLPGILAGCGAVVLDPSGDVALQQRNLIIESTVLMLLIIVPVIALTLIFARHYREGNTEAVYDPEWHHSTQLKW